MNKKIKRLTPKIQLINLSIKNTKFICLLSLGQKFSWLIWIGRLEKELLKKFLIWWYLSLSIFLQLQICTTQPLKSLRKESIMSSEAWCVSQEAIMWLTTDPSKPNLTLHSTPSSSTKASNKWKGNWNLTQNGPYLTMEFFLTNKETGKK